MSVALGCSCCYLVTQDGEIYAFGSNSNWRLGIDMHGDALQPVLMKRKRSGQMQTSSNQAKHKRECDTVGMVAAGKWHGIMAWHMHIERRGCVDVGIRESVSWEYNF